VNYPDRLVYLLERRSKKMNTIDWIARILVIIGALNWGIATFNGTGVLGGLGVVATIIYALRGLAGIWEIIALFK
jgi:uncharacterized membrane protein YuzA (DUF378 family)